MGTAKQVREGFHWERTAKPEEVPGAGARTAQEGARDAEGRVPRWAPLARAWRLCSATDERRFPSRTSHLPCPRLTWLAQGRPQQRGGRGPAAGNTRPPRPSTTPDASVRPRPPARQGPRSRSSSVLRLFRKS